MVDRLKQDVGSAWRWFVAGVEEHQISWLVLRTRAISSWVGLMGSRGGIVVVVDLYDSRIVGVDGRG